MHDFAIDNLKLFFYIDESLSLERPVVLKELVLFLPKKCFIQRWSGDPFPY